MDHPDSALHARFREGDESAFRELVAQHESRIRDHLDLRLPASVRRRVSVADVMQEALVVAFDRREDFEDRGDGAFGAWLRGIAERRLAKAIRHHAGTRKRSVGREVTHDARPDTGCLPGRRETPSVVAMSAEEAARIRAARDSLPEDYRTVIELTHEQGLTLREVGESMGRSREATKKLYGRAMVKLREAIRGGAVDGP